MKFRAATLLVLFAIVLAFALAAVPSGPVSAQICVDPNQRPIPCPEKEKKQHCGPNNPCPTPATSTPTATLTATPTASAIPSATPTASPNPALAPPPSAGGFACPPFVSNIPIGAAVLGAGIVLQFLARRGGAASLPAMNQGGGSTTGAAKLIGTGLSGLGSGPLGAGLLGGALGMECISAPLVLPVGALLGLFIVLAAGWLLGNNGPSKFTAAAHGNLNPETTYSTFEMMGTIAESGSVTGSAGMYSDKELE
ncbi:MAG TPA: hypothetical protein VGJ22_13825 [Anaerolineales bacterium]|jgi:hypothetical protein